MSSFLYSVTLTDLGTYRVTVAADSASEAQRIAKSVLYEEATQLPPGTEILKRETEAVADIATEQPIRRFKVEGCYRIEFSLVVPAANGREAERHAQRIYSDNCGPFEFDHDGGNVSHFTAREIVS